jgi:hypothetical protein
MFDIFVSGCVLHVVEHLSSKHKALNTNPSTAKKVCAIGTFVNFEKVHENYLKMYLAVVSVAFLLYFSIIGNIVEVSLISFMDYSIILNNSLWDMVLW